MDILNKLFNIIWNNIRNYSYSSHIGLFIIYNVVLLSISIVIIILAIISGGINLILLDIPKFIFTHFYSTENYYALIIHLIINVWIFYFIKIKLKE